MSATRRRRPPQRGQASTSNPKVRAISAAQDWPRARRRAASAVSASHACAVGTSANAASRPSVQTVEELRAALKRSADKPVLLLINGQGSDIFMTVPLAKG